MSIAGQQVNTLPAAPLLGDTVAISQHASALDTELTLQQVRSGLQYLDMILYSDTKTPPARRGTKARRMLKGQDC